MVVVVSFFFVSTEHIKQRETAEINKPKYLCDTAVADCSNKNTSRITKGVCVPGGKCT